MPSGENVSLMDFPLCKRGIEGDCSTASIPPADQSPPAPLYERGVNERGIKTCPTVDGRHQTGFTLLAVLFLVAAVGVGLAAVGTAWETAAKREKETQLLFVGDQYRRAIERYRLATPGTSKRYPASLADLLEDHRFPNVKRHLRRLYPDPVSGGPDWGLVMKDGGIAGVYSLSQGEPLKKAGFSKADAKFEGARSYRDWVFAPPAVPK